MPIWLKNLQRTVIFNEHLLKLHAEFLLNVLGAGPFDVSVVCVGSKEIQHLNKVYRKRDKPTDVLSFPYHEVCVISWECHVICEWGNLY